MSYRTGFASLLTLITLAMGTLWISSRAGHELYLPVVIHDPLPTPPPEPVSELRGLWISRFDWTTGSGPADPARIDQIVADASHAGFNALFFQVRGTADAFYNSPHEPWARRVSGTFGQPPDPLWDPLERLISQAHAAGIEVHAWLNLYPLWDCITELPLPATGPQPLYHQLIEQHGTTLVNGEEMVNGLQWLRNSTERCVGSYWRVSPASIFFDDHIITVISDIATRYQVDGIHIDHVRYGGTATSCDPVSLCRYHGLGEGCNPVPACELTDDYKAWQRRQINGTVRKVYEAVQRVRPDVLVSAAVWPVHTDKWGWGASQGFHNYYQDSKAWLASAHIDAIAPMIYSNPRAPNCADDDSPTWFWNRMRWETLVADYQADNAGRWVIPGIGVRYCTFDSIVWRIEKGRELGVPGHSIFSYSYLRDLDWFDALREGPYREPAVIPVPAWKNGNMP
jgi:uncharacterized lipoprotein YddW (UPF0748 family)